MTEAQENAEIVNPLIERSKNISIFQSQTRLETESRSQGVGNQSQQVTTAFNVHYWRGLVPRILFSIFLIFFVVLFFTYLRRFILELKLKNL